MAGFLKHYGSWHQELNSRDLLRYVCVAVIGILGIAGLFQSLTGRVATNHQTQSNGYGTGVYSNQSSK